jgi:LmbE family N-acetylglucosaminyl deacetylase
MKRKKVIIAVIMAAFLLMGGISIVLFFSYDSILNIIERWQLDDLQSPGKGDVVLLVAPHPDDEALSSRHLVQQALANGAKVKLLMVTNGDGFIEATKMYYKKAKISPEQCREYALMRQQETIAAAATMGIPREDILFLGFPDGGIEAMMHENWSQDRPYTNPYTMYAQAEYANAFRLGVSYTGVGIVGVLASLLQEIQPNVIIMPHPNDHHPDHRSVNAFMQLAAAQAGVEDFQTMLYLVHHGSWPTPWVRDAKMHLVPPAAFQNIDTKWRALDLSPEATINKGKTIELYKSQTMVLGLLMYAFERRNELFGELPPAKMLSGALEEGPIMQSRYIVLHDPPDDNIGQYRHPDADIVRVYAMAIDEGGMRLVAETNTKEEVAREWRLFWFFIEDGKFRRLEIEIDGGVSKVLEDEKVVSAEHLKVDFIDNHIDLLIPADILGAYPSYYIMVSSFRNGALIDTTAMRELISEEGLAWQ